MMKRGKDQWNIMPAVLIIDDRAILGEREWMAAELDRVLAQLTALMRLGLRAQPPGR